MRIITNNKELFHGLFSIEFDDETMMVLSDDSFFYTLDTIKKSVCVSSYKITFDTITVMFYEFEYTTDKNDITECVNIIDFFNENGVRYNHKILNDNSLSVYFDGDRDILLMFDYAIKNSLVRQ